MDKELSDRDKFYNAILAKIKNEGAGLQTGLVRAVLYEVNSYISMGCNRVTIDTLFSQNKIKPRE